MLVRVDGVTMTSSKAVKLGASHLKQATTIGQAFNSWFDWHNWTEVSELQRDMASEYYYHANKALKLFKSVKICINPIKAKDLIKRIERMVSLSDSINKHIFFNCDVVLDEEVEGGEVSDGEII